MKSGLMGIGVAVGAARVALAGMVKATADYASEVHDLSITTGISAENLQVLGYAGKLAGVSMEEVAHGLMRLSRSAYEAATSGGAAGAAFYRLGISAYDAAGKVKEPNQLLTEIAAALTKVQNPTERAALSMELMGRSGARLTQTLTKFGGDMEAVKKQAVDLGIVLDDKTIQAGNDLGDTLDRVNFAIKGVVYAIGAPLLGKVRAMAEGWVRWLSVHRKWIALKVHEAIEHVSTAMDGLYLIGTKIVEHPTLLKWLIAVGAAAMAVMFPLTALSLLIAGMAEDLALFFKDPKADTLTRTLVDGFDQLKEKMLATWSAFKSDPFARLREWATDFFAWFVEKAADLPDKIAAAMGDKRTGRLSQTWRNFVTETLGIDFSNPDFWRTAEQDKDAVPKPAFRATPGSTTGYSRIDGDYYPYYRGFAEADGSFGAGLGVLAPTVPSLPSIAAMQPYGQTAPQFTFSPVITVEAHPGVDGAKVGADLWDALEPRADDWLGRKVSAALGATNR